MQITTLSNDNQADAVKAFEDLLAEDRVLFVVLGSGAEASDLVNLADGRAGATRWVVWASNPALIQEAVAGLPVEAGVPAPDLNTPDRAFVISLSNTIVDVISSSDQPPNVVRVFQAFAKGN